MLDFLKDFLTPFTNLKAISIIIAVGLIVYFFGLFNGFVIDDGEQIVNNLLVHSIYNFPAFFTGGTFFGGEGKNLIGVYYKPITITFFSIIYNLLGPNSFWFHLSQLIIHVLNASILFLVFRHFFKFIPSLMLGLIFLVHPINSESVFYISAMQEVLFFLFGILAFWLILKYKTSKHIVLAGILLLLSFLSKETGILFIVISIVYAFIFKKEVLLKLTGVSALIISLYVILRSNTVGFFNTPLNAPIDQLSLLERIINMPSIIYLYIKSFIFPLYLSSSYQWAYLEPTINNFLIPFLIVVLFLFLLFFAGFLIYRTHEAKYFMVYIFFSFWLLIGLGIHIQIIPLDSTVANRWFYFPIVGVLGVIGIFFNKYSKNKYLISILIIILILLSVRTFDRGFDWKDDFTLATNDVMITKDSYDLENRIASGFLAKGDFKKARLYAERSVKLYPYATNYSTLGSIYLKLGDYRKARESYLSALKYGDYYAVYVNLCVLDIVDDSESSKGMSLAIDAIKKFPFSSKLWTCYAILEYQRGSYEMAKEAIAKAYALSQDPETTEFYDIIINNKPLNINVTAGQR